MAPANLQFDQRACFIAGQAKSGTTLLAALLDNHPQLLVLPQETAYFATVLKKYGSAGRRRQFDYLTKESFSRVLFGGEPKWREHEYKDFPQQKFLERFEQTAFEPANAQRDLLALMAETYAVTMGRPLDAITRWIEKTPANRNHVNDIFHHFPNAKLLVTLRDPRAILATQIALEKARQTKRFSVYYVIAHWRVAAKLATGIRGGNVPGLLVPFEQLVSDPAAMMKAVCDYLEIGFDPNVVLKPTKIGEPWGGNSAAQVAFRTISAEPASRWEKELSEDEIGWVEWHCRDLMPQFGYEPRLASRKFASFVKPIRQERPREYLKSRAYSLRDAILDT
ncbi:MAG TPA: sulfotransferase [Chthoniobacterales bacterium]|nr:sulfotransferase [Chthoniobacterales bacterium]